MSIADVISAKMQFGAGKRARFYEQLVSLMRSRVERLDAIKMIRYMETDEGKKPKNGSAPALTDIIKRIEDGDSFGVAMQRWVPRNEAMVLKAIENSRDFPDSLSKYLEMDKKRRQMISSVKSGMIQPVFSITVALGVVIYMGSSVMPIMSELLPMERWSGMAYILALLSYFAENIAFQMIAALIILAFVIRYTLPRWAGMGRRTADKFPIYAMYRRLSGIDFLVSVSSLTSGGVTMVESIEQLMESSNPYVRRRLVLVRKRLVDGEKIGSALHATKMDFPDRDINLQIKILEETQDINSSMTKIAEESLDQVGRKIDGTMKMVSIGSMGVTTLVIAIISFGIVTLNSQISEVAGR